MNKLTKFILFGAVMFIAVYLRFYRLGNSPNGLYVDEASIGYNAFSVLKTAKDEFGKQFPIVFRSFADFKTPVYIYLTIPMVYLFGLSEFSVRLISALAGAGSVFVIFFLVKRLLMYGEKIKGPDADMIALIASFTMAVSPWAVMMSRSAFETNLALFLLLVGIYLLYLSFERSLMLLPSALFFALSLLSYHAERIIVPVVLLVFFLRHKKFLLRQKSYLAASIITGLIIIAPSITIIFTPGFLIRAGGLNIFNFSNQLPAGYVQNLTSAKNAIVNFIPFLSLKEFSALYLSYFSPRNLFFLGDPDPRVSYPQLATFFIWQLPFLMIGLFKLIESKNFKEFKFITMALLLISPIPASITRDPFTTIRSYPMVVPLTFIISFGIYSFVKSIILKSKYLAYLSIPILILIMTVYSLYKFDSSWILTDFYRAKDWNYGYKELTKTIADLNPNIPVIIDNARVESYSEILFFSKYDSVKYQTDNFEVSGEDYYKELSRNKVKIISNIITRNIDWEKDSNKAEYLIGDALAISDDQIQRNHLTLIKKILYPDLSVAFVVVKTNPLAGSRK